MRHTIAALPISVYILLWNWQSCNALRVLRYATQFVTLLAASTAFIRAATCVLHATSFITSSATLHYTSFAAIYLLQVMAHLSYHTKPVDVCTCLFASWAITLSSAEVLTGFHSVYTTSCIHFSRIQSTRCLLFCVPFVPAAASALTWLL